MVVTLASAALVIPYLLFSPLAGRLAKIYKKRKIVVWAKFAEMLIMVVAAAGFLTHSTGLVLSSILLMGLQSALFSPSKYGLIRDIGGEEGISYGSGAMEMFAFVGILTGTLMAAFLSESVTIPVLCVILFGVALFGWLSSLTIRANESEPMKESHETLNPVKFVKDVRAGVGVQGVESGGCGTGHVLVYRFDDPNGAYRVLPFGFGDERFGDGYRDVVGCRGNRGGMLSRRGVVPSGRGVGIGAVRGDHDGIDVAGDIRF